MRTLLTTLVLLATFVLFFIMIGVFAAILEHPAQVTVGPITEEPTM